MPGCSLDDVAKTPTMVLVAGDVVALAVVILRAGPGTQWQSVCAIEFSPDGRSVAAGSYRGTDFNEDFHWCIANLSQTVALFDALSGSCSGVLDEVQHHGTSRGLPSTPLGQFLGFSPDGNSLAVGTWDGEVRLWDTTTRQ